jgi:hypothetical protein
MRPENGALTAVYCRLSCAVPTAARSAATVPSNWPTVARWVSSVWRATESCAASVS